MQTNIDGAFVKNGQSAQMQAWVVSLIQLVTDAFNAGTVLGAGARLVTPNGDLQPAVLVLLPVVADQAEGAEDDDGQSGQTTARHLDGQPALAVEILSSSAADAGQAYAQQGIAEYWHIDAETGRARLYQRNVEGRFDEIPPDKQGLHFSSVIDELVFPVAWFEERPGLWEMMEWWGLIEREEGE